jgi:hypothetical protein
VAQAFGTPNIRVFTESEALQQQLRTLFASEQQNVPTALLLMSSGTFDGVNIKEFAAELIGC